MFVVVMLVVAMFVVVTFVVATVVVVMVVVMCKLYIVYLFFQQLYHLLCKGGVRTTIWSQYEIRSFGLVDSMRGSCTLTGARG